MKLIHWLVCGSTAVLGCVLLPANSGRRVEAQAPPPVVPMPPAQRTQPAQPTAAPPAAAPQPEAVADDKPAPTVLKVYDVGDLVRIVPDRPLGPGVLPPTQLNGSLTGRAATANNMTARQTDPADQNLENLIKLIEEEVAPDSWREAGGSVGSIHSIEKVLMVRQTAENQREVGELLELFRKSRPSARAVTIHADWLWLNPGELAQVVKPAKAGGGGGREIDPAALAKLNPKALYAHGQITCAGGQTVHLLSGRVKTLVENLDAEVGTGTSAYQPEVDEVLEGAALQVTPHLQGDSAVVDVLAFVSGWGERSQPYRFLQHDSGPLPATRSSDPDTTANANSIATMDRMNVLAQEYCTTAHLPLGKVILIGGMTLEPEGSGANSAGGADTGPDRKSGDGRQLHLLLRVDAE